MVSDLVHEAIRDPTSKLASEIFSEITPEILGDSIPSILGQLEDGESSEVLAEQTLDQILTIVETEVLDDGVNFVIERFGDRIIDMILGNMFNLSERIASLIVGI